MAPSLGYAESSEARRGVTASSLLTWNWQHVESAAPMQETTEQPTLAPEAADGLTEAATRAEDWAGEPFLRSDDDPAVVLDEGTARRRALDDAVAEIEAGNERPSYEWRRRYALMLGL